MTVQDIIEKLNLKVFVEGDVDREVTDCYIGDLLSWVMGRAPADSAWLTVMGNINSIAVATLADVSCIILVENAALDADAKGRNGPDSGNYDVVLHFTYPFPNPFL